MSYYLELLHEKGLKLTPEQIATRNALSYAYKNISVKKPNKMRLKMELEVEKTLFKRGVPRG